MEVLIGIAVGSILIAAATVFLGRGININREQFEQVLTTEDARLQLDKVSDRIREAQGANWLIEAGDNQIKFYSDIDDDNSLDTGRVFIENNAIKAGITRVGAPEIVLTLARSVRNISQNKKLFTYYDAADGIIASADARSSNVKRIGITLLIDVTPNQSPGIAEVNTVVTPRATLASAGGGANTRFWPVDIDYPNNPLAGTLAEVTITNPTDGSSSTEVMPVNSLNDGRLQTYSGYYTNINYLQATDFEGHTPGWYAWIGPILVGQSGDNKFYMTDVVPVNQLCLGDDLNVLLSTCPQRAVGQGVYSVSYQPIITYGTSNSALDYVRGITFNYVSGTPPPSPTPPLPPGTIFSDAFSGLNGTELYFHAPEVGTSWTKLITTPNYAQILHCGDGTAGGNVTCTGGQTGFSAGTLYTADAPVYAANYEVQLTVVNAQIGDFSTIMAARIQDANNMYAVRFNSAAGGGQIYKKVGGTWTALGSAFNGPANGSVVKFVANGSTLSFYDDGVLMRSVTDTGITAAGKAGLGIGAVISPSDDVDSQRFDDFRVKNL